ncbi:MAG: ATP-dependent sacrificial sulfur transferase LarE [Myxococcota bacterium]|nr:ATP-dependent sacrificial sulfur transferase LarE [Myxococcota bacterium]
MLDKVEKPTELAQSKLIALRSYLSELDHVLVAYSGGVDSAFLLRVAYEELRENCRAFTARSPSLMDVELEEAAELAKQIGVKHVVVDTHELDREGYTENSTDRCYYCKSELFDATAVAAEQFGSATVLDGFNADDLLDHRPGHKAAAEKGVLHPLAEVGLTKYEIRCLSHELGLPTWSKPQLACLASRVPYGTQVTLQRLSRIGKLETALRQLNFYDVRARLVSGNDDVVRIEIGENEFTKIVPTETRAMVIRAAKESGFSFVTLDLEGFRSGRMNEGLVQLGSSARY